MCLSLGVYLPGGEAPDASPDALPAAFRPPETPPHGKTVALTMRGAIATALGYDVDAGRAAASGRRHAAPRARASILPPGDIFPGVCDF